MSFSIVGCKFCVAGGMPRGRAIVVVVVSDIHGVDDIRRTTTIIPKGRRRCRCEKYTHKVSEMVPESEKEVSRQECVAP